MFIGSVGQIDVIGGTSLNSLQLTIRKFSLKTLTPPCPDPSRPSSSIYISSLGKKFLCEASATAVADDVIELCSDFGDLCNDWFQTEASIAFRDYTTNNFPFNRQVNNIAEV
uniref:Uncharacterized protein n=1 Tax=Glossina austeni TaxID=7395 RepID=A0A1A9UQV7_GLOAU